MFAIQGFLDTVILGACIWKLHGSPVEEKPVFLGWDMASDLAVTRPEKIIMVTGA